MPPIEEGHVGIHSCHEPGTLTLINYPIPLGLLNEEHYFSDEMLLIEQPLNIVLPEEPGQNRPNSGLLQSLLMVASALYG